MGFLISLTCVLILLIVGVYCTKDTVLGLTPNSGNYIGTFFWMEMVLFIVPSIVLLNTLNVEYFEILFKVKQNSLPWITSMVGLALLCFFIVFKFMAKIFPSYLKLGTLSRLEFSQQTDRDIRLLSNILICISVITVATAIGVYGAKHAFISALNGGQSISLLRYGNHDAGPLKFFNQFLIFFSPLLCILAGTKAFDGRLFFRLTTIFVAIFAGTYYGSKGPLMNCLMAFIITYSTFHQIKPSISAVITGGAALVAVGGILYFSITLQYTEAGTEFIGKYLVNRIFIAQMAGVYEEFNLFIHNIRYTLHSAPFASLFIEVPIFHKDLMLISEGRVDPNSIGIKNTLFIAEAYGMGGWPLLVLSPFIYAVNLCISIMAFIKLLDFFVFKNLLLSKLIIGCFMFSFVSLTGGFSELLFFKLPILSTLYLIVIITVFFAVKTIKSELLEQVTYFRERLEEQITNKIIPPK